MPRGVYKRRKKLYSMQLTRWVDSQIPGEIIRSMINNGWNAFGIYELVKQGIRLEQKGNLSSGINPTTK